MEAQKLIQELKTCGVVFPDEEIALLTIQKYLSSKELRRHADIFTANNPDVAVLIVGSGDYKKATEVALQELGRGVGKNITNIGIIDSYPTTLKSQTPEPFKISKVKPLSKEFLPSKEIHTALHGDLPQKQKHRKKRKYF